MKSFATFRVSLLLGLLGLFSQALSAATVDSLMVYSPSMDKGVECVVVVPDSCSEAEPMPTVYFLHGFSDNPQKLFGGFDLVAYADRYSTIIVVPDGGFSSWYWDSPIDSSMRYETFVARELTNYIDSHYSTIASSAARAVTGYSMGGQGAMYLSIRNQDVFGAAGSMSGGVDIRPFPTQWEISKRLGTIEEHPENWEEFTVMNQLDRLSPDALALIIDCGVDDFFFKVNNALHEELENRKIPHTYITAPGVHNLEYWQKMLPHHLLFFSEFFRSR